MSVIPFPYNLIVAGVAVAAIVATTFAFTRGVYVAKLDVLKAQYTQAGKDAQKQQDDLQIKDNYVTKEANNEIVSQLANAKLNADRLSNDSLRPLEVCHNHIPVVASLPTAAGSGESKAAPPSATVEQIAIDPTILDDIIKSGVDNIDALLIISKWEETLKAVEASK